MNETILFIIFLLFAVGLIAISFALKSPRMKKYVENLEDRKLAEQHVHTKYFRKRMLTAQYLIFVPLVILAAIMPRLQVLFVPAMIIFLCLLLLRKFFGGIEFATATELEYRKLKKNKTDS